MDPLTALNLASIAGNILQFVGFTGKLITSTCMSSSASGTKPHHLELASMVASLHSLAPKPSKAHHVKACSTILAPPERDQLKVLSSQCLEVRMSCLMSCGIPSQKGSAKSGRALAYFSVAVEKGI